MHLEHCAAWTKIKDFIEVIVHVLKFKQKKVVHPLISF